MYEFIIKDKPIPVKKRIKISIDKIPSTNFNDLSDNLVKIFKKFADQENQTFGHNSKADIVLISDKDDKILDIIHREFANDKTHLEKNFFIHTSFYNIPALLEMNFYIKGIKLFELNDKILIHGEFMDETFLLPQSLLNVLEICDFLIHKYFRKEKPSIIEKNEKEVKSINKNFTQQKIVKFNYSMEEIFNFTN